MRSVPTMNQVDSSASDNFTSEIDFSSGTVVGGAPGGNPEPEPQPLGLQDEGEDWDFGGNSNVEAGNGGDTKPAEAAATQNETGEGEDGQTSESQSEVPSVSIDIRGKQKTFKLDPNDEVLRRTLRNGERAVHIKQEAEKLKVEHKAMSEQLENYRQAHDVFNEIQSLQKEGEYERIVRAVLGDKFDGFVEDLFGQYEAFKSATPQERALMERERSLKDKTYAERVKDREIQRLKEQLSKESTQKEDGRVHGYATAALTSHKLTEAEIPDADVRHNLNKRTWNNAWDTLKQLSATRELTPDLINKVFEREFKLIRYGQTKGTSQAASSAVENKKQVAATKAAAIATSNYPGNSQASAGKGLKWNGKDAKDLLRAMMGR
jgi:hypothetical protein